MVQPQIPQLLTPSARRHVRHLFAAAQGNARVIAITEGVAAASFQWYRTYVPLYMLALGVTEAQIGLLASVLIFTQFISTLLGGYVADRFGRKRVLVIFDILCWGVPMLLYAVAQNPWYFLIGQLINGFVYIVIPSFQCLFVEDVPIENRTAVFGLVQFLMSGARLLAPVAGWLVAWLGIITGGRIIMTICMVSAVSIAIYRQFALKETTMGRARMADTVELPPGDLIGEYVAAIRSMVVDRRILAFLTVRNLVTFNAVIWTTYSAIYLTDRRGVGLPAATVALFPFVTGVVTMGMILLAAGRMRPEKLFNNLIIGQVLSVVAALCFLASPQGTIWWAVLWAMANAVSVALFAPAHESYWANIIGDRERALVFSAGGALTALFALPAGPLAGTLYTLAPRWPFLLALAVQLIALVLTWSLRREPVAAMERRH